MATGTELRAIEPTIEVHTAVPAAGRRFDVGRWSVDGRPVFGVAATSLDGIPLRAAPAAARSWPDRPVSPQVARDRVANALTAQLGAPAKVSAQAVEGWILVDGALAPVTRVDALLPGPSVWTFSVDAADGRILRAERTSREARGRVYAGSPFTSGTLEVELPGVTGDVLDGPLVRARSCDAWEIGGSLFSLTACDQLGRHAVADASGDFLYFPTPASYRDPFAEVHLYWHADRFVDWLGRRYGLTFPYGPVYVNGNFPLANAFFGDFDLDGIPEVSFGTDPETGTDFGYDADVVYHELGHAVVGEWAPSLPFLSGDAVGLEWTGGAVNEGMADLFSMVHAPDPLTGEYAGSAFGDVAIRDLEAPRRCPDDLLGEVHADGELLGAFGWQLVSSPDVGTDGLAELLAGAIPRLGSDVTWPRVGAALHDAADDALRGGALTEAGHAVVLDRLAAANLEECGRVIPLDDGREVPQYLVNGGLSGPLERLPGGVGFSIDVPEDAVAVRVIASDFTADPGMGLAVYGRWDDPVGHDFTVVEALGIGFSTPAEQDLSADLPVGQTGLVVEVVGDELRPGRTLFVSIASVNRGTLAPLSFEFGAVVVSAEVVRAPAPPSGPTGCSTSPVAWARAGLGAIVLLAALTRRGARAR